MITITILNITVVLLAYLSRFKNCHWMLGVAFVLLSIVLGIRYDFGNDYFGYYDTFKNSFNSFDSYNKEIGWFMLNKLFHPIGYMGMVFVITCLEHFLLFKLIIKHVPPRWYWFAVFIYVFYYNYMLIGCSMMRQFLAMIIGLYAMESVGEKRWVKYALLSIIAFFIHKSSAVLLLILLIPVVFKLVGKTFFTIGLLFVFLIVLRYSELIYEYVASYLVGNSDINAFQEYFESRNFEGVTGIGFRQGSIILLYLYVVFRNFNRITEHENPFCLSVMTSYFIVPFTFFLSIIVRLTWYFSIAEIICYPLVIAKEKNAIIKIFALLVYIVFTLWSFISFFSSETYGEFFINYKTVFSAPQFI